MINHYIFINRFTYQVPGDEINTNKSESIISDEEHAKATLLT